MIAPFLVGRLEVTLELRGCTPKTEQVSIGCKLLTCKASFSTRFASIAPFIADLTVLVARPWLFTTARLRDVHVRVERATICHTESPSFCTMRYNRFLISRKTNSKRKHIIWCLYCHKGTTYCASLEFARGWIHPQVGSDRTGVYVNVPSDKRNGAW